MTGSQIKNILLIEDNPDDAFILQETLRDVRSFGYNLTHVETLQAAIRKTSSNSYDIILLDLILPDSDEKSSFPRMKGASPHTAIVILSGMRDAEMAVKMVKSGAQDYLIKGEFTISELERVILYAIERKIVETELEENRIFLQSALDGLVAHIAILDENGTIIKVNQAWRNSPANTITNSNLLYEGVNFLNNLETCEHEKARTCARGIRSVLEGETEKFEMECTCDIENTRQWLSLKISSFKGNGLPRVVFTQENITKRKLVEEELKKHQNNLENKIQERTHELRSLVKAMSGRELRMAELKRINKKLTKQIFDAGMVPVANDPLALDPT